MKYIDIVVDNNTNATDEKYTYACLDDSIALGNKVSVPFARSNRLIDGYVVAVREQAPEGIKRIKEVASIDSEIKLSEEALETALWMRNRYLCRYIEAIKLFLPDDVQAQRKTKDPFASIQVVSSPPEVFTKEQSAAFERIAEYVKAEKHKVFLLFGVTGSGKTEIYLQAMEKVIQQGRMGIVLVPEISLTPQAIQRFMNRFGKESVAVLHSKLTRMQKTVEYKRIESGQVKVVIGARSAVFAPAKDIGLIILDEEHETSYKSDKSPKYDTLEVAVKRAMSHKAVVVAGSATPSLVDYYRSENQLFERLELSERFNEVAMPAVRIVDMRDELKAGNKSLFSEALANRIAQHLKQKKQVILFINRRGYSSFVACRECGYVVKCPECGISMTFHKDKNACVCHYCGKREAVPKLCPACGSRAIKSFGVGTQQVEEKTKELFPEAVTARLDLDSVKKKGSMEAILSRFQKGAVDILVGTQLVAKGLDFKNVGLVGIISADITLNIPDFRSAERTFQLVTQAAGRSGRGDEVGEVVIQTYSPEHSAIVNAAIHDYKGFYQEEIHLRKQIQYPPFGDIFQILIMDEDEEAAMGLAERCAVWLRRKAGASLTVMAPCASALSKANNMYRYRVLIKSPEGKRKETAELLQHLKEVYVAEKDAKSLLTIDINPYSFL
ncbi:MAG: primosomal protein N' [Clostridia bacterium]|nr:primosomal protein N' [Clostridia bacterium]